MKKILALCVLTIALTACQEDNSGTNREARASKQNLDAASVAVGTPAIMNYSEKRLLKMLYELRDQSNLVTYSYFTDMNGNLHKICPSTSVGFGIPYSTQFTSPKSLSINRPLWPDGTSGQSQTWEAPQPEPNGLYMPDSTNATWVICLGDKGKLNPVYVEPQVIVSLTPMTP